VASGVIQGEIDEDYGLGHFDRDKADSLIFQAIKELN
jgi:hypothetical protein